MSTQRTSGKGSTAGHRGATGVNMRTGVVVPQNPVVPYAQRVGPPKIKHNLAMERRRKKVAHVRYKLRKQWETQGDLSSAEIMAKLRGESVRPQDPGELP